MTGSTHKKFIFLFIICLLLSFILILTASCQPQSQEFLEVPEISIKTEQAAIPAIVTIVTESDYPPYSFLAEDGKPDGLAVELFKAVADKVGLEVQIKIGIFSQMLQDLIQGRIDALPLVNRTKEREEWYDFTFPFLTVEAGLFVHSSVGNIKSIDDLKDKSIVAMRGSYTEDTIIKDDVTNHLFAVNTYEEAFQMVNNGFYDTVIAPRNVGLQFIEERGLKNIKMLPLSLPDFREDYCFAVHKGNEQLLTILNDGLAIAIADGTYERISRKWLGPKIVEGIPLKKVYTIVLVTSVSLLIIFLLAFILFLRREVNRRTVHLKDAVEKHKKDLETLKRQQLLIDDTERISKVGSWEYDVEKGRISYSKGVYEIYGMTKKTNILSTYSIDSSFYLPEAKEALDEAFQKALKKGEPYDLILGLKSLDGINKWVHTIGHIEMDNGGVKRLYGNIMDITDQINRESELGRLKAQLELQVKERTAQLEEQIEKIDRSQTALLYMVEDLNEITAELEISRKRLEESNQGLEAFAFSVSHDLRVPLRAINGFSQFLLEDYAPKLDSECKRYVNIIRENTAKMDQLITDLLNLSRISRAEMNLAEVNMAELAGNVYNEIATEKEKEEFKIKIREMPIIKCDKNLMKQVWQNLIENALKFSAQSEKKEIEIGFFQKEQNNNREKKEIIFFIRDSGIGFNPRYSDKMFGVFKKIHREGEFAGTGVGLAIVRRIIANHGGKVWAEGKVNQGATFYFTLPVHNN